MITKSSVLRIILPVFFIVSILMAGNIAVADTIVINNKPYHIETNSDGTLASLRMESAPVSGPVLIQENILESAWQFIGANASLFLVPASELSVLSVTHIGQQWVVKLTQTQDSIPVLHSLVVLELSEQGEVILAGTKDIIPSTAKLSAESMQAALSKAEAVEMALTHCESLQDCSRQDNFLIQGFLAFVPFDNPAGGRENRLAWTLTFKTRLYWIDANTGEVLYTQSTIQNFDVTGKVEGKHTDWGSETKNAAPLNILQESLQGLRVNLHGLDEIILLANGVQPVISGDGKVIAFVSNMDGDREIFKINSDGTGLIQLTHNTVDDYEPDLSDDGQIIVFTSVAGGVANINRVNADGTGLSQVTTSVTGNNRNPSVSDDGTRIAFESDRMGNWDVYVIGTNGIGEQQLTANGADDIDPSLSGDGSRIAYSSNQSGGYEIYVVEYDGTNQIQVTFNLINSTAPAINDDGKRIAFVSDNDGDADIYTATLDSATGWNINPLTFNGASDIQPDLSGDGLKIAYASDRDGDNEIFTMDYEGSSDIQITHNLTSDTQPYLSDDGSRLVYTSSGTFVLFLDLITGVRSTFTLEDRNFLSMNPLDNIVNNLLLPGGANYDFLACFDANNVLSARLSGKHVTVNNVEKPNGRNLQFNQAACPPFGLNLLFNPGGAPDTDTAQVNAYYYTDALFHYLDIIYFRTGTVNPLGHIPAFVNKNWWEPSAPWTNCQAYYLNNTINFYKAGDGCPNTAYDTVIFHEYGHYLDDKFGPNNKLSPDRALSEGIADMSALYATGFAGKQNPEVVGENFQNGQHLRNYNPGEFYAKRQLTLPNPPKDPLPGQIESPRYMEGGAFAGFAWHSRDYLLQRLGGAGINVAENVFFSSLQPNRQNTRDAAIQVFYQDDMPGIGGGNNSKLKVETPHYDDLRLAACRHGFDTVPYPGFMPGGEISWDWGDAPKPYPTVGDVGARHGTIGCEWLGNAVTRENSPNDVQFDADGQTNLAPFDTDHADDGVTLKPPFLPNGNAQMEVVVNVLPGLLKANNNEHTTGRYEASYDNITATRQLYLNAWLDWNGDGEWKNEDQEKVIDGWFIDSESNKANHGMSGKANKTFNFPNPDLPAVTIPAVLTDKPFAARFRLDFGENVGKVPNPFSAKTIPGEIQEDKGRARYGEVEDYLICVNQVDNGRKGNIAVDALDKLKSFFSLVDSRPKGTETLFGSGIKHVFFGISPPLMSSMRTTAVLMLNEENKTFRIISNDSVLGLIDSGEIPLKASLWNEKGKNPKRIILDQTFVSDGQQIRISADTLLIPYNRSVMDLVNLATKKRVRYLLKDCYNMAQP